MEFATPPPNISHPPHPPPPSVPPGWTTCFNEQYQAWFFVNLQTQQSQWQPPSHPASPQHPVINEPRQETDEEMAQRLQAEFEREASGPVASSPFQGNHAGSSPYPQSNGAYVHSSSGEYNSSFASGEPWGQPPPQQHHQQQQQKPGKDGFSKVFDKYSHKIPMAGTLGAATGLAGSHSAPTSRPGSPHGSSHHTPHSHTDANGNLALPGQGGNDKKKKRSSWGAPLAAGAGGAAVGAAATYALSGGASKVKNKFLYGSSSGSGWEGDGKKKKKKGRSSWSGANSGKWDGLGGEESNDGDDGGDDWGLGGDSGGGGDDGGGIGEVLSALVM